MSAFGKNRLKEIKAVEYVLSALRKETVKESRVWRMTHCEHLHTAAASHEQSIYKKK
jgi:hypothetical protein